MLLQRSIVSGLAVLVAACGAAPPQPGFDRTGKSGIEEGRRLATVLGCNGCHGADLTGQDWSAPGFITQTTANLTQTAARYTRKQMEEMIRTGKQPGGRELWDMPSHLFTRLSDHDMQTLLNFLYAQPRRGMRHPDPGFFADAKKEMAAGTYYSSAEGVRRNGQKPMPDAGPGHERARYIVRATCAECHGEDLRGGVPHPGAPPRPDLRMVAAYSAADFDRLMTTGKAVGNRELKLMSGVARGRYAHFTGEEREAVRLYLTALAKRDP